MGFAAIDRQYQQHKDAFMASDAVNPTEMESVPARYLRQLQAYHAYHDPETGTQRHCAEKWNQTFTQTLASQLEAVEMFDGECSLDFLLFNLLRTTIMKCYNGESSWKHVLRDHYMAKPPSKGTGPTFFTAAWQSHSEDNNQSATDPEAFMDYASLQIGLYNSREDELAHSIDPSLAEYWSGTAEPADGSADSSSSATLDFDNASSGDSNLGNSSPDSHTPDSPFWDYFYTSNADHADSNLDKSSPNSSEINTSVPNSSDTDTTEPDISAIGEDNVKDTPPTTLQFAIREDGSAQLTKFLDESWTLQMKGSGYDAIMADAKPWCVLMPTQDDGQKVERRHFGNTYCLSLLLNGIQLTLDTDNSGRQFVRLSIREEDESPPKKVNAKSKQTHGEEWLKRMWRAYLILWHWSEDMRAQGRRTSLRQFIAEGCNKKENEVMASKIAETMGPLNEKLAEIQETRNSWTYRFGLGMKSALGSTAAKVAKGAVDYLPFVQ